MALNRNNFLRFVGGWTPKPYTLLGGTLFVTLFASEDSLICNPLSVVSASNGIDTTSFRIISITDGFGTPITLQEESEWDGVSNLTFWRPTNITLPGFIINFTFSDVIGNENSIPSQIVVTVSAIITEWRAYPVSSYCVIDAFGNNNGYQAWYQLQLFNSTSGLPISPLTLKSNLVADPDYIAPVTNLITCPTATPSSSTYAPLYISNFSNNGADANPNDWITITQIYLYNATAGPGSTPVALVIPCLIQPNQTGRFNVISGIVWQMTITFAVQSGGNMVTASPQRFWKSQISGVIDDFPSGGPNPVINTSPMGANPITIIAPLGVTIFAQ